MRMSKASPLRPGSSDYHFEKGGLIYHDTYFGAIKFIGEEIVYKSDKPAWGMNYYGFTLNNEISEGLFDSNSSSSPDVRFRRQYTSSWTERICKRRLKYTFNTEGDLANFTGVEEISKNGKVVCRLYCHGGFIE